MINITQLQTNLETEIQNLTGSESAADILTLTAALNNLTTNRFVSVQNYGNLPDLTTNPLPSGSLVLVKQLNIMMMSVGTQWRGIDGRVYTPNIIAYSWGSNNYGRLGDNTVTARSSPVTVVGGITNWSYVSPGYRHSLGLTRTGVIYSWGSNAYGQLGDNTTSNRSSPVTVVGGITNWKQTTTGSDHSIALTISGIIYTWGRNLSGQLGTNNTSNRSSPVTVVGGISTWSQISAGNEFSLGLTSSGILYAWGANSRGQLGNNSTTVRSSPVTVVGGITNWTTISAAFQHSLGVISTGIAYAWGYNSGGRLGDNTTSNRSSPVTIVGGITNWTNISSAQQHSLGITSSSSLYAWGSNSSGQLGTNNTSSFSSPVTVVGGITNWKQVSAGGGHNTGITTTGIAYAWGYNGSGRLGDNTESNRSSPVTIVGGITTWSQISAGRYYSMGLIVQ